MTSELSTTIRGYKGAVAWSDDKASKVELAASDRSRANLWCLKPGQGIHPHVHDGDHVWVVMEGTGEYLASGSRDAVTAGDILFVPAGRPHGIENTGSEGLVFVSISA